MGVQIVELLKRRLAGSLSSGSGGWRVVEHRGWGFRVSEQFVEQRTAELLSGGGWGVAELGVCRVV